MTTKELSKRELENLNKVIDQYYEENQKIKKLEEEKKSKNLFIKEKLEAMSKLKYCTSKCKVSLSYASKNGMDEDKAIKILKENVKEEDLKKVIKTKEYIDYDELESLIYNDGISADKLEPAQTSKSICRLTVSELKGEENDKK